MLKYCLDSLNSESLNMEWYVKNEYCIIARTKMDYMIENDKLNDNVNDITPPYSGNVLNDNMDMQNMNLNANMNRMSSIDDIDNHHHNHHNHQ